MYLLGITLGLCLVYVLLYFVLTRFFEVTPERKLRLLPLVYIVAFSFLSFLVALSIEDIEWGNRILHALGGGFVAFFACFLCVWANKLPVNRFQFWFIGVLIVTALGVVNEMAEFIGQNYFGGEFADHVNDTWLDLISNSVGLLVASAIFTPLISRQGHQES